MFWSTPPSLTLPPLPSLLTLPRLPSLPYPPSRTLLLPPFFYSGPGDNVDAAWSPNGEYIVTANYQNQLCVFDTKEGKLIKKANLLYEVRRGNFVCLLLFLFFPTPPFASFLFPTILFLIFY